MPSGPYHVASPVDDPDDAAVLTPAQWGETVYVAGLDIVPEVEYQVQADCGLAGRPVLTAAVVVETPMWGDVTGSPPEGGYSPPDGIVNVLDVSAVVDVVKHVVGALPMYAVDLYGCVPDQDINVIDIAGCVDALKDKPYTLSSCPGPCWQNPIRVSKTKNESPGVDRGTAVAGE